MWTYHQSTGQLFYGTVLVGQGYAGHGADKNVPAAQGVKNMGPLPQGFYSIGLERGDTHLGPYAMPLEPDDVNVMYGRSGFWMHAESIAHPGDASSGCIVMPDKTVRIAVSIHPDKRLQVVA